MIMADSYFLERNTRTREIQMKKTDKECADDILMAILEEEWRNLNGKVSF